MLFRPVRCIPVVFCWSLLVARSGRAAPPRLTLDDALASMQRQSPAVLAAALRVRAARADVTTAGLWPNPTLQAGVGNFAVGRTNPRGLGVGDTVVSQVGIAQELVLWGKRGAAVDAATARVAQADAERADVLRAAETAVRQGFFDVLVGTERLRLAEDDLRRYRETVRLSEARAHDGDISPAEMDKVALELRTFERAVDDARDDRRTAVTTLLPLLGLNADDLDAAGQLTVPGMPGNTDDLVAGALARRPDLRAAQAAATAATAHLRLAHAEAWPNPTVGLQYTHSEFQVSGDLPDQIGVNVSVPLPVLNRNQGEIARADAERDIAAREIDRLQFEIPQQVRRAVAEYETLRARVARYREQFLQQAEHARTAAEASYREGAISLLELLEAERTALQTQRDHLDALRAQYAAWTAVRQSAAVGDDE